MWDINRDELERLVKNYVMYAIVLCKKGIDEESVKTMVESVVQEFIDKKEGYQWEE